METLTYVIWMIWIACNKSQFENQRTSIHSACFLIVANVKLSGNLSHNSIHQSVSELLTLKAFDVNCHPKKGSGYQASQFVGLD